MHYRYFESIASLPNKLATPCISHPSLSYYPKSMIHFTLYFPNCSRILDFCHLFMFFSVINKRNHCQCMSFMLQIMWWYMPSCVLYWPCVAQYPPHFQSLFSWNIWYYWLHYYQLLHLLQQHNTLTWNTIKREFIKILLQYLYAKNSPRNKLIKQHIRMNAPIITTKKAATIIDTLTSLEPQPLGTNIDALETDLIIKLSGTPSYQSRDKGYGGMIEEPAVFALRCPTPWVWRKDPGSHFVFDPELNRKGQANKQVEFDFEKGMYDSEQNILGAAITGLNAAVPAAYRKWKGVELEQGCTAPATIPWISSAAYAKHMDI